MRLNEISYNDASPIDGYGPGFFRVGGKVYHDALLLTGAFCFGELGRGLFCHLVVS